ncbi:MAG: sigma-70 family RNA polymerase sigma factor [Chloroflexi bacterium]|nr:sigma-70 family RNA polymerase sigma factor [Chloroflexota bacterium]
MNLAEERKLLARAQAGPDGFGDLFDAHYERIYAYAYRRVGSRPAAEDIAACTFEDALRGIQRVRWRGRPIIAWLYRIASRRVADYYRQAKEDAPLEAELVGAADDGALEQAERQAAVRAGLGKLNPTDREIIQLAYFDECETAEIAALLNCTANVVYVRLHRALRKLRAILQGANDEME